MHTFRSYRSCRIHCAEYCQYRLVALGYKVYTWLRHGSTSVQPVDVFWSYRVTVSARTAAGLLPSLVRRPGTLSRIISGIRTLLWTTSSACWKCFCSQRISVISALDVSRRCATNLHFTYLLTYFLEHGVFIVCALHRIKRHNNILHNTAL